jgi:hypothetical protein
VTFDDGTTALGTATLSGGTASFTIATLSVGTHSITAVYGGDGDFTAGTSAALKQVVKSAGAAIPAVAPTSLVDQVLGALSDDSSGASDVHDLGLDAVLAVVRRHRSSGRN